MFSRRRSTQDQPRTGLFRRRETEPAVAPLPPAPPAPPSAPAAPVATAPPLGPAAPAPPAAAPSAPAAPATSVTPASPAAPEAPAAAAPASPSEEAPPAPPSEPAPAPAPAPAPEPAPTEAAVAAATLPSPPQSPPVQPTGPPVRPAPAQAPAHWPPLPGQARPPPPPHQLASPPQSPPFAPRDYGRPPPPPPIGWQPPHQAPSGGWQPPPQAYAYHGQQAPPQAYPYPGQHPPPHAYPYPGVPPPPPAPPGQPQAPPYTQPHVANLTELEAGTAQPNFLLPPGPNGTVMGMTMEQLEARNAALAASPLGRLSSFLERFETPPQLPPRPPPDARLNASMANMFISRGADPAAVQPHIGELAGVLGQATTLMNQRKYEDAYQKHREAWHAANPKRGVFGTRPPTPPMPPLPAEDRADPEEYLAHALHGGGLIQAPVPGCKYCEPFAKIRAAHGERYVEHQALLRRGREERWNERVRTWRVTYGRDYDHGRASTVEDRFGNGWDYLEGGAAWDAEEARIREIEARMSSSD